MHWGYIRRLGHHSAEAGRRHLLIGSLVGSVTVQAHRSSQSPPEANKFRGRRSQVNQARALMSRRDAGTRR